MSSLGVNPTIVLAAFVVSLVLAVIVVLCQDLVQVKMRFSSSQPASCNSSC